MSSVAPQTGIHLLNVPSVDDITAMITAGGGGVVGTVATIRDVYENMRLLAESVNAALVGHMSSNNITHDQLEAEITGLKNKVGEHVQTMHEASTVTTSHPRDEEYMRTEPSTAIRALESEGKCGCSVLYA